MTSEQRLWDLVELVFRDDTLLVTLGELIRGKPDGYIGSPLLMGQSSERIELSFEDVSEFRSVAEPCYKIDGARTDISEYLCECVESNYAKQSCTFGGGPGEHARHFCVLTESVIVEVLCSAPPIVGSVS